MKAMRRANRLPSRYVCASTFVALLVAVAYLAARVAAGINAPDGAPNARLSAPVPLLAGPSGARFTRGLLGWQLLGPGGVGVRVGGPSGHYAAVRDNTTLVSAAFTVPKTADVLLITTRVPVGAVRVQIGARAADGVTRSLASLNPGSSWSTTPIPAQAVRGQKIQLVIDPTLAAGNALDVASAGESMRPAPSFTLRAGAVLRSNGGPGASQLVAAPGPLDLRSGPFRIEPDARSLTVWAKAAPGTRPTVELRSGSRLLASGQPTGDWTPLRAPVGAVVNQSISLGITSADANGLALALIGTEQHAPKLAIERIRKLKKRVFALQIRASKRLSGGTLVVIERRPNGTELRRRVRLDSKASAMLVVRGARKGTVVRVLWPGSEQVTAGFVGTRL